MNFGFNSDPFHLQFNPAVDNVLNDLNVLNGWNAT
jgi:hypothetical protein